MNEGKKLENQIMPSAMCETMKEWVNREVKSLGEHYNYVLTHSTSSANVVSASSTTSWIRTLDKKIYILNQIYELGLIK